MYAVIFKAQDGTLGISRVESNQPLSYISALELWDREIKPKLRGDVVAPVAVGILNDGSALRSVETKGFQLGMVANVEDLS